MTPDKLQGWIYKPVPGGSTLQLTHDQAIGPSPGMVVASWSRSEVDNARECNVNQAEQVLEEAQAHADSSGEACRFLIQWVSDVGRPLRTLIHRAAPSEPTNNVYAANADSVSTNAMVAQLLNHIHQQQKVLNGSMGTVLGAYDKALAMQQLIIAQQNEMLRSSHREIRQLTEAPALTPGDTELAAMKVRALDKLMELGPDVLRMAIASFIPQPSAAEAAAPEPEPEHHSTSNGKAAAA